MKGQAGNKEGWETKKPKVCNRTVIIALLIGIPLYFQSLIFRVLGIAEMREYPQTLNWKVKRLLFRHIRRTLSCVGFWPISDNNCQHFCFMVIAAFYWDRELVFTKSGNW